MKKTFFLGLLLVSLFVLLPTNPVFAEGQTVPQESLTPDQWVGQTFVFLAMPANKQKEGYEIYPEKMAQRGFAGDPAADLPYANYFSKQVVITDAIRITDTPYDYVIHMKVKSTGEKLVSRTFRGQLEGLGYLADREKARKQFVGKTIYSLHPALENIVQDTGSYLKEMPLLPIGTPMEVIDVWDGMQSSLPVWLVARVNGSKVAIPMAYSWTNLPRNVWNGLPPWQDTFSLEDPRKKIGDSPELWNLIQSRNIKPGMTQYEVRISWGAPNRIETVTVDGLEETVWTYGDQRLRFSGDRLIVIE